MGSSRDEAQRKNVWRWRQEIARKAKAGGAQLTGGRVSIGKLLRGLENEGCG